MVSLSYFILNGTFMKQLFIVRHAKSSWDYLLMDDSERPLNKRGQRDVPIMGKFLKGKISCPSKFISSPAVRAFDTAVGFAFEFGQDKSEIIKSAILYHGSISDWFDVIGKIDDKDKSAMLFGHNPGITALVNRITDSNIYNVPTCGAAGITLDINSWSEIEEKKGELKFYYYPKGINL